jgi:CheY-like chemotaxis protein
VRDIKAAVVDMMMPVPKSWGEDSDDTIDAHEGDLTGVILLRRCKKEIVAANLPVLVLTNKQKADVHEAVEALGFPPGLVEVRWKLDTPSFMLPTHVQKLIARNRKQLS